MKDQSSLTALLSSFGRAYHAANATHPVFADPIAKKLMTGQEYETIGRYILGGIDFFAPEKKGYFLSEAEALRYLVNTQIAPTPLARAKFCEDSLQTAIRTGTRQYVILGAGMDTFAFRNPDFMEKYSVYEVDHPLTQADKRERIRRAGLSVPERLHFVPVDFSVDSLYDKMISAGFDPNQKTFFSWLGVSYYLSEEQIGRMLESIAKLSAKGST
ncbi:MAG: class I SAM-dependent methyltransferase, partial [Christensenellaceae bacterium]